MNGRAGQNGVRKRTLNIAGMPESTQASVKGAELSDSYDACAIFVDKRSSGAVLAL